MSARLRLATVADAAAIREVYAPYCEATAISFEASAPTVAEMEQRIEKITAQFPWLVCEVDGKVLGYAYACAHRERAAYRWSVDAAVYVKQGAHRKGLGRALYTSLFRLLQLQGYHQAHAGITLPNPASVGLHEALGFKLVGVYPNVGYKLGAWRDVGWWQLNLIQCSGEPAEPRSIADVKTTPEFPSAINAGVAVLNR